MMEQIVALFEDFREHHISFDDLYKTLRDKIQQDATFRHQAIPTLDQVQHSTPIPITDFIALRSQLSSAVEQAPQHSPEQHQNTSIDPDATLITPLPGESTHPNAPEDVADEDETLVNLPLNTEEGARASDPTLVAQEDIDEATMIMPAGKLGAMPPTLPSSEDETVVTLAGQIQDTASADTLVASMELPPESAPTLVASHTSSQTLSRETYQESSQESFQETSQAPLETPSPATPNKTATQSSIPKSWVLGAGLTLAAIGTVIIAVNGGMFGTPKNNTVTPPPPPASENEAAWGKQPSILQPTASSESSVNDLSTPAAGSVSEPPPKQPEQPPVAAKQQAPEKLNVSEEKLQFSSVEAEIEYLFDQIMLAEKNNHLGPVGKHGTATYYLAKLIKVAPDSPLISQARSRIAKAHLALANIARENERWDEAQQHLDDAFNVRLPDSYR